MYDRETNSLWSQLLGQSMEGPLVGSDLVQIPSVMTDWQTWYQRHPQTTVISLSRTSKDFDREYYQKPDMFVLGIVDESVATAWSLDVLLREGVINDSLNKRPVLVAMHPESFTARLYDRTVEQRVLTFQMVNGKVVDRETGTVWDAASGRAVSGELADTTLKALPAILSFKRAWFTFHPKSRQGGAN